MINEMNVTTVADTMICTDDLPTTGNKYADVTITAVVAGAAFWVFKKVVFKRQQKKSRYDN